MDEQGKPLTEKDELGRVVYSTKKGEFRWSQDFVPEYFWFDGSTNVHLLGDRIDAANPPVSINKPNGDYADPNARIWPMKVHRGKQPYDPVHQSFVIPKLFGKKGTGAYWKHFDWGRAIEAGMRYVERPYSGKYDFVETEMYWPIAHMVAPKEQAVPCEQCHQREEGRLAALTGFYMPGRDRFPWLDWLGWLSAAGVVVATAGHGALRYRGRRGRGDPEDRGSDERGRQSEDTGAPDDGAADEPSSPPESEPPSSGGRES